MENFWLYLVGFSGQALFGSRLIVQLILSEKAGKVLSPTIFWHLSLGGSFIFLIYGVLRSDPVIIAGQTISYYIYIRNLQLKNAWTVIPAVARVLLWLLPAMAVIAGLNAGQTDSSLFANRGLLHPVFLLGLIGQLSLNLRFVYQWYYSERLKTSVLPVGFWHISTWGSVLVIIYAAWNPLTGKADPVLLVSQAMGIFVYARNLVLHYRNK